MEWAWLAPTVGVAAFIVLALFNRWLPRQAALLALAAMVGAFGLFCLMGIEYLNTRTAGAFELTWLELGGVRLTWGIFVDPLAIIMVGIVSFVALLIQAYSLTYMAHEPSSRFLWYFAVHSLFAAAMIGLVLADNFLFLYIAWELVGLCSYLLIGFWSERRSAAEAAKKAFVVTRLGDVGLLTGILWLFMQVGTFDMATIFHAVDQTQAGMGPLSGTAVTIGAMLLFLGAMGKSAQFPLHVWLPDAMEGPTPVSALIHAATMVVAGVYLVARAFPLFVASDEAMFVVATVGLITALLGAGMALVMTDLKRILAYSTMSHLGFMMLALGAGGLTAGMYHLLTHAFAKALLFLGAGVLMHAGLTDIRKMGGLRRSMPITFVIFTIGALALSGVPPLGGFFSKDEVLMAILHGLHPIFFLFALLISFLSALYTARILLAVFFGNGGKDHGDTHEIPRLFIVPMAALAIPGLLLGGVAGVFGQFIYADHPETYVVHLGVIVSSLVCTLLGFYVGWQFHTGKFSAQSATQKFPVVYRTLVNKLYLDAAYQWCIDRVVLVFSSLLATFDRVVINDGVVNEVADTVLRSGRRIRLHQTGRAYNYALAMVAGVVVLVVMSWFVVEI